MIRTIILVSALASPLAMTACASVTPAVNTDLTNAEADFAKAVQAYNTAKQAAALAEALYPSITADVTKVEAVTDPIVTQAVAAEAAASTDAPTIEAQVVTISSEVASLISEVSTDAKSLTAARVASSH